MNKKTKMYIGYGMLFSIPPLLFSTIGFLNPNNTMLMGLGVGLGISIIFTIIIIAVNLIINNDF